MEEEEGALTAPAVVGAAKVVERDASVEVKEHEVLAMGAQQGWLAQVLQPILTLLQNAKDGPLTYLAFLMAITFAVIVFLIVIALIAFVAYTISAQTPG